MNADNQQDVPLQTAVIDTPFWADYRRLVRDIVVPYQWEALNDGVENAVPSHAVENFRIAAGESHDEFHGMVFQDSDVTKWLEAVAYLLAAQSDDALEAQADAVIALIARAQQGDGYLNTYFTVKAPQQRWTNLAECHELYCAGHLIEAAVAYFQATGKSALLDVAKRFVDHIDTVFGPDESKLKGYPGHPEIELALMRLYDVTHDARHIALARFFIEQRGTAPHFYDIEYEKRGRTSYWDVHGKGWMTTHKEYSQAHRPIAQQTAAVGHAVRLVYLYTGVAHLARLGADASLLASCKTVWRNMVDRQMYVTGAIGAQVWGESFTSDYDLPNDTAYTETCASVGMAFFARQMLQAEHDSRYADVLERVLYNTVLAGLSLDGKSFFYVNPLETHPRSMPHNHKYEHVKTQRQRWFGCACCPPNVARLIASLGQYIYTVDDDVVYINMYVGGRTTLNVGKQTLSLRQESEYPWNGDVRVTVDEADGFSGTLAIRLPDWCAAPDIRVNGTPVAIANSSVNGYVLIRRPWLSNDVIDITLPMEVRQVSSHPKLRHTSGKVALQRGPIVYCLEEEDNDADLHRLCLPADAAYSTLDGSVVSPLFAGKTVIRATGFAMQDAAQADAALYRYDRPPARRLPRTLTFIPYFCWANRREGEMRVWIDSVEH